MPLSSQNYMTAIFALFVFELCRNCYRSIIASYRQRKPYSKVKENRVN